MFVGMHTVKRLRAPLRLTHDIGASFATQMALADVDAVAAAVTASLQECTGGRTVGLTRPGPVDDQANAS